MIAFVARIALVALSLGSQVGLAIADGPAKLNVAPSCDAAARGAVSLGRNAEACMDDDKPQPQNERCFKRRRPFALKAARIH
jgi:hypothetical protein